MFALTRSNLRLLITKRRLVLAVVLSFILHGIYHSYKPLPAGLNYLGALQPVSHAEFLADMTYQDTDGERHIEQPERLSTQSGFSRVRSG